MEHPKDVGDRSTLAVMLALRAADYAVFVPFGENTRCDLVIDDGATLARVQCKTGRLRNGAVTFKTCSRYMHHPHPKMRRATMSAKSTSSGFTVGTQVGCTSCPSRT
jgi:PD-(D/E)XK nuclease superfamily protein